MTREELENRIRAAVADYIIDEETYDDNAQLCIDLSDWNVYVEDSRNVDVEAEGTDCYDVMDFVEMSGEEAGKWIVDSESVAEVAAEYF